MNKVYNLEQRACLFAKNCRFFVKALPKSLSNIEDGRQLIGSSGSVGANYIEANEKLGDKDFKMILKIARKEAKESEYWLRLLKALNANHKEITKELICEAFEQKKMPYNLNFGIYTACI